MSSEINMIIDNLCQKLGTSATFLIPELAKRAIAENIVCLLCSALFGCGVLVAMRMIYQHGQKEGEDMYDMGILFIFPSIALMLDFGFFGVFATDLAGWIASPTAKAIGQIASMIK